jgi:hypothetical protein
MPMPLGLNWHLIRNEKRQMYTNLTPFCHFQLPQLPYTPTMLAFHDGYSTLHGFPAGYFENALLAFIKYVYNFNQTQK